MKKIILIIVIGMFFIGCKTTEKADIVAESPLSGIKAEDILFEAHIGYYTFSNNRELGRLFKREEYMGKLVVTKDNVMHCDCLNPVLQRAVDTQMEWRVDDIARLKPTYVRGGRVYGWKDKLPTPTGNQELEVGEYWWRLEGDFYPGDKYYKEAFLNTFFLHWSGSYGGGGTPGWFLREVAPCVGEKYLKKRQTQPFKKYDILDALLLTPVDTLEFHYPKETSKGTKKVLAYKRLDDKNIKCK